MYVWSLLPIAVPRRLADLPELDSQADSHITVRGSDWLWACFAVLLASAVGVTAWGMMRPSKDRIFLIAPSFGSERG